MAEYYEELPEPAQLRDQLSYAIDHWRHRNQLIKKVREYIMGENPISAPKSAQYKVQLMHTWMLLSIVNEKAARFLDRPVIQAVARGVGQQARDLSTRQERWLREAWAQMDKNSGISVWSRAVFDALAFDLGVYRIECAPAAFWPEIVLETDEEGNEYSKLMRLYEDPDEFEKQKELYLRKQGVPLRRVYVPADTYLPLYNGPTPEQEFMVEYKPLRTVLTNNIFDAGKREILGSKASSKDQQGLRTQVCILHMINQKHHAYYALVPGQRWSGNSWPTATSPELNNLGEPLLLYSYEHGINRSPVNTLAGRFGGFRSSQDWVEGALIEALCMLNQDADELMSQAATYHRNTSWPTPVTYFDPLQRGAEDGPPKPLQIQEGQNIALWTTERMDTLFKPEPNPMFESLYDKIYQRMNDLSGSAVLFGGKSPGVDTGYHHELQISQSEHLDVKIEENLAAAAVNDANIVFEYVKHLGEKVYVHPMEKDGRGRYYGDAIYLSGKELDPMPTLVAKVRGTSPLNVAANMRAVIEATTIRPGHNSPLYDDQTALEKFMGEEAPDEIMAKRDIQREKTALIESGKLTNLISQKLNMMLVQEDVPNVTPEMAANVDPALQRMTQGMVSDGTTEQQGGVDPAFLSSAMQGRQMMGIPEDGAAGMLNGRGGGLPTGLPQPEQQAGLAIARRQGPAI